VAVRNPAFDVTPHRYVTAIVTERGIARAPYGESLARIVALPFNAEDAEKAGNGPRTQRTEEK
jgi:initiation factor 2B subunit 1/2 family protein